MVDVVKLSWRRFSHLQGPKAGQKYSAIIPPVNESVNRVAKCRHRGEHHVSILAPNFVRLCHRRCPSPNRFLKCAFHIVYTERNITDSVPMTLYMLSNATVCV